MKESKLIDKYETMRRECPGNSLCAIEFENVNDFLTISFNVCIFGIIHNLKRALGNGILEARRFQRCHIFQYEGPW